jgi:hypothetical protein
LQRETKIDQTLSISCCKWQKKKRKQNERAQCMYLAPGTETGISSTAQIGQIWSRDAIAKKKFSRSNNANRFHRSKEPRKNRSRKSPQNQLGQKKKKKNTKENSETA